jgi:hypothetical protein
MLWYGANNNNYGSIVKKTKQKINKAVTKYAWSVTRSIQINKQTFHIYKPSGWNAIILNSKHNNSKVVFFSSANYFFKLSIPVSVPKILFDPNTSMFILHTAYINNNYRLFLKQIDLVFNAFYRPYFRKIKFKGKGYYIYKNKRNTITPQFGYSHRLYLYSYFVSVRFLSKTSIFLFGLLKSDVITISLGIKSMRPINIFTGRGVRFSREIIYKKVGKVSSYR